VYSRDTGRGNSREGGGPFRRDRRDGAAVGEVDERCGARDGRGRQRRAGGAGLARGGRGRGAGHLAQLGGGRVRGRGEGRRGGPSARAPRPGHWSHCPTRRGAPRGPGRPVAPRERRKVSRAEGGGRDAARRAGAGARAHRAENGAVRPDGGLGRARLGISSARGLCGRRRELRRARRVVHECRRGGGRRGRRARRARRARRGGRRARRAALQGLGAQRVSWSHSSAGSDGAIALAARQPAGAPGARGARGVGGGTRSRLAARRSRCTRSSCGRRDETCPVSTGRGTRRVQLVRDEGRDVSS